MFYTALVVSSWLGADRRRLTANLLSMVLPPYCGRWTAEFPAAAVLGDGRPDRVRYTLRAQAINPASGCPDLELAREVDTAMLRDKIANHHIIPMAKVTVEDLWQQLRADLDARDSR